ncbi:hypothetical protein D918_01867 [Trichuris suis]|nr:hypothetical protein D918_01867 [Trichuris suis]
MDNDALNKRTMLGLSRKRKFIEKGPVDVVPNPSAQPPTIPDWVKFAYETCSNVDENERGMTICDKLALRKIGLLLSEMERKKCRTTNDSQVESASASNRVSDGDRDLEILKDILRKEGMNALIRSYEREMSRQRAKAIRNAANEKKSE